MATTDPAADALVDQARAGSRAAFSQLVRRHQPSLFRLCLRLVHDRDVADDLTQKALVRAMDHVAEVREVGVFQRWLAKIALNLARNHMRDSARFVAGAEPDGVVLPDALAALERAELSEALSRAVAALPTRQRQVVSLRVYEDRPFREIAAALRMSVGAAKVNFHYGVKKLRASVPQMVGASAH